MILACLSVKGGAGKSTVAVNLAAEFQRRRRRVLLVDADPQGTCRVWAEIAVENGFQPPTVVAMGKELHRPGQLDRFVDAFDVIVIDCPGRDGAIVRAALMVSHIAVIPCGASPADAWALAQTLELLDEARVLRPELVPCVAVTRKRHTSIGKSARADLAAAGVPVLATELGERVAYQQSMGEGRGVVHLSPTSNPAAREIRSLAEEILGLLEASNEQARSHVA
jgi:chromosome partitioning protein